MTRSTTDMTELVTIGKIEKPFGVRGEVRVRSLSDVPGRFEGLKEVTLVSPSGRVLNTAVSRVRSGGASYILGLDAFSTPEEAALFRGGLIQIPRGQSPALPPDQYYEGDLIGMEVRDEAGRSWGTLEEVWDIPGNLVFVVRGDRGEQLIPAVRERVASVDVAKRLVTVRDVEYLEGDQDAM
ncbi:MAG: ribosome maturation factor RimM [Nitrospiraceae bacterium]